MRRSHEGHDGDPDRRAHRRDAHSETDVGDRIRLLDAVVLVRRAVLGLPFRVARDRLIQEFERRYVASLLALHEGNVARAASASGLARRYFNIIRARNR
jgi:hypothetical protein